MLRGAALSAATQSRVGAFRSAARIVGPWLLVLVVARVAAADPGAAEAGLGDHAPIRICWEDGLKPPFLYLDDGGRPVGTIVDLVAAALERAGLASTAEVLPWQRCLRALEQGRVDLVPNASHSASRTAYALYTRPVYETHLVLLYLRSRWPAPPSLRRVEDLRGLVIGGLLGFNYPHERAGLTVDQTAPRRDLLIRKLRAGRVDLALVQREVIEAMAARGEVDLEGIGFVADPLLPTKRYHLLVGRATARAVALRDALDRSLGELERDGRVDLPAVPSS